MKTLFNLIGRVFAAIINRIYGLLGYPPLPTEEQKTERLITMRCGGGRDCAVPVTGNSTTAAGGVKITYEQAHNALHHADLPGPLESPLLSNPKWLCLAIESLGFKANDKAEVTQLLNGELPPGATIVLWHAPGTVGGLLGQHWITYEGQDENDLFLFHWGKRQELKVKSRDEVIAGITNGSPNCIIVVSK